MLAIDEEKDVVKPFATRAGELAAAFEESPTTNPFAKMVWTATMGSLTALRSVLDGSPYAAEESEFLEQYAQAHAALLDALRDPVRGRP